MKLLRRRTAQEIAAHIGMEKHIMLDNFQTNLPKIVREPARAISCD
jgi:uncharacterized protein YidB (DUF937 family)